jgi:uncharacterized protein (TIGR03435 family)
MRTEFVLALVLVGASAAAQTSGPEFEVATIKLTNPAPGEPRKMGIHGGPGTSDPSLFTCDNCSFAMLFSEAYGVPASRMSGPSWARMQTYNISAKVPEGARKDQVPLMLRNLLIERLKLATHREKREMAAYDLVAAKGGTTLKLSVGQPASQDAEKPVWAAGLDKDGYPNLPPDFKGMMGAGNGRYRYFHHGQTMSGFADWLSNMVGKPIFDQTGLAGKYNIDLRWKAIATEQVGGAASGSSGGGPGSADWVMPLMDALQPQLGLRLESKKRMVEVIIIDHAERIPLDN